MQNTTVSVIIDLNRRVDAANHFKSLFFNFVFCEYVKLLSRLQIVTQTFNIVNLLASESERITTFTVSELQWQNSHTDKIGTVNTLETFCNCRT